jgi:hypothetical protein
MVRTTELIADDLAENHSAAMELASLCAFLAPEPIPIELATAEDLAADGRGLRSQDSSYPTGT